MKKLILPILVLLVIIPYIISISFLAGPTITTNEPSTNNIIECTWVPSGDTIEQNYTWYNGSTPTEYNGTGASPAYLPAYVAKRGETWSCEVMLYNGTTTINSSDSVLIVNANPVNSTLYDEYGVNVTNQTVVIENTPYTFDINSSDPDGDPITYTESGGSFDSLDENTGVIIWTPDFDDNSANVTFFATDDQIGEFIGVDAFSVEFIVVLVNDSPTISTSNQIATEDILFVYDITAIDEENDPVNFSINYTKVNGEGSLSSLIINKKTNLTANITFNRIGNYPTFDERGNYTVTVIVVDSVNSSRNGSDSFNLEIVPLNQLPTLQTIPNASATQGDNFLLQINATDGDADAVLSFTVTHIACALGTPWNLTTTNSTQNGTALINLTLTNDHVVCQTISITVEDENTAQDSQMVVFNITNTNDAPIIHPTSDYVFNTPGNYNNNLSSANGAQFTYKINASDNDTLTYEGEVISYSSNETLFPIDSNGIINVTLNTSHIGNWSIEINVSDDGGLSVIDFLIVNITQNTIPIINNLTTTSCVEDSLCTIYVDGIDPDIGAVLTFSSNETIFNVTDYNDTSGRMQYTYNNSVVGNYSVKLTVTDELGASNTLIFTFGVNNTNDPPYFDMNGDDIADNVTLGIIVETYLYQYLVNFTDEDLIWGDSIVVTADTLVGNTTVFNISQLSNTQALISFTPQIGDADNYTVRILLNDSINNTAINFVDFEVFQKSGAPVVDYVRPHSTAGITNFGYAINTYGSGVSVNFTEDRIVTYEANATDPDGDTLSYKWFIDGIANVTTKTLAYTYNFGSSGSQTIKVSITDEFFEIINFTWSITVEDLNQPPELKNNPKNMTGSISINGSRDWGNYFSYFQSNQRFYDADDDSNANGLIDGAEILSLTYNESECVDGVLETIATFSYSGSTLTVTPEKLGTCIVKFTATDSFGSSVSSGNVLVNVTALDNDEEGNSESTTTTSNRGGGSSTNTVVIPITEEVDSPTPLKIITPGRVVLYKQKIMQIPILLRSNWTEPLYGITLEATTNNTEIILNLSEDSFTRLDPYQEKNLTLIVTNFRESGPYEIYLTGRVASPEFEDTEIILVNSIEAADDGDVYETKITFARDFFNENKECQELNELLNQAETAADEGSYRDAIEMVDAAINGCKYLSSQLLDAETQTPSVIRSIRIFTRENAVMIVLGTSALMIIALGIFFTRRKVFE